MTPRTTRSGLYVYLAMLVVALVVGLWPDGPAPEPAWDDNVDGCYADRFNYC